ncbi:hypothetical protein HS125_01390 [bacterium]|nr:hypothetical protein [bacterium]
MRIGDCPEVSCPEVSSLARTFSAARVLLGHYAGATVRSRRFLYMLFLLCVPLAPVVLVRIVSYLQPGAALWRTEALRFFDILASYGYLNFMVVLIALFWATPLYSEELSSGAARFLFLCPVPRAALPPAKFLAYSFVSSILAGVSLFAAYYLLGSGPAYPMWRENLPVFFIDWGLIALALAAYGAFFSLLGLLVKRPLLWGLLFAFIWDTGANVLPGSTHYLTLRHYFRSLFPNYYGSENMFPLLVTERPLSAHVTCYVVLAAFIVVSLLWAGRRLSRMDVVVGGEE